MDTKVNIRVSAVFPFIAFFFSTINAKKYNSHLKHYFNFWEIHSKPKLTRHKGMFWLSQSFTEIQRVLSFLLRDTSEWPKKMMLNNRISCYPREHSTELETAICLRPTKHKGMKVWASKGQVYVCLVFFFTVVHSDTSMEWGWTLRELVAICLRVH